MMRNFMIWAAPGGRILDVRRYAHSERAPQPSLLVYLVRVKLKTCRVSKLYRKGLSMAGLAMALFIALFAFGGRYLGWTDTGGHVQLALFTAFIFGIVCGTKIRG
ncbi:MAG: hypothetical protein K2P68_07220 [Sphingomonas sp.]|nr:hypothetical protein [Sphingomonas sp.]